MNSYNQNNQKREFLDGSGNPDPDHNLHLTKDEGGDIKEYIQKLYTPRDVDFMWMHKIEALKSNPVLIAIFRKRVGWNRREY